MTMQNCICWEAQLSLKVMGKSVLQDLGRGLVLSQDIRKPGDSAVKNPPAMQEMWVCSLRQEDSLEEEMTTHSSILAVFFQYSFQYSEIPWTEEPGGLQSMESQKIWMLLSK